MSKITLAPVGNLIEATSAQAAINSNSVILQNAFENTFSRDGTSPNTMGASLDMNSHSILNLPAPVSVSEPLRLQDLNDFIGGRSTLPPGGTINQVLKKNSSTNYDTSWGNAGSGTVTSVGLVMPAELTVTNTPITTSGNISVALTNTPSGTGGFAKVTNATLTSPTLVTPNISTIVNTGTLTLPVSTDVLVGRATSDTLTNKVLNSCTLSTPTINGTATGTGVSQASSLSTLLQRDSNGNSFSNSFNDGYQATIPAGGSQTLLVGSFPFQYYAGGSGTHTVTLPVTSTLTLGKTFTFWNLSGGVVTVNSSGGNLVATLAPGSKVTVVCNATSGTTAASWSNDANYFAVAEGKRPGFANSISFAGTDSTTVTFPTVNTDFSSAWTVYSPTVTASTGTPGTVTATGRYKQIGKTVHAQAVVTITAVGTASGNVNITLPVTAAAFNYAGIVFEGNTTGKSGAAFIAASASVMNTRDATATSWWVNGYVLTATITYEVP